MEYLLTFLEGFASFISPCVLPLIPLYVSYFAGSDSKKSKALKNSIAFVLGFSIVFILLAVIVNTLGVAFSKYARYIKIVFGVLVILLGLGYMDILKIEIFSKFKKLGYNVKNLNFFKSLVFGMLFSISMTPCVGTFLTSALLLIATKETILKGLVLIVLYCVGLGLPFIISSVLIERLKNVFNVIKKHYDIVKKISGIILIVMGIYLIFF